MMPVRVMIVEDSRTVREFLERIIGGDARLRVVASVASAEEAMKALSFALPDVISMDIHLPGMNGLEATQRIMSERPTPIVVVSGSLEPGEVTITMNALRAGALSVVEKPVGVSNPEHRALAERLCTQLAIMSQVRVIRQRFNRERNHVRGGFRAARGAITSPDGHGPYRLIGMVASTGGPSALQTICGGLPADFPLPILLVQHLTPSFLGGFVSWLNDACELRVVEAADGLVPRPGHIYVAPADRHLSVEAGGLRLDTGEPVCMQRPSGTVLLRSLAREAGQRGIGVVLTGMGEDGADGLAAIQAAGGYTIAQDEHSAAVYGMPGAAARLGAVRESLAPPEIARRLVSLAVCSGATA